MFLKHNLEIIIRYAKEIVQDYGFTEKDSANIAVLKTFMAKYVDDYANEMYENLIVKYKLPENITPELILKHKGSLKKWFYYFLEGKITNDYASFLKGVGCAHIKHGIEAKIYNGMFSWTRLWIHEKVFQNTADDLQRKDILMSMHKLLDINDDLISSAYYECELKKYSSVFSIKDFVISVSEKFSFFLQIILLTILIFLTIFAVGYFSVDIISQMSHKSDHFIITSLSSLLMIWVLSELLFTEINIIKGAKFKISVFMGVALIAFVRDLLIMTLNHEEKIEKVGFVLVSIAVLGITYWLIAKTEKAEGK